MELTDSVYSSQTGVTHLYYNQRHLGMPVYNAQLQFNVAKDGRILSINNSFVPGIAALARTKTPTLRPEDAVLSAAGNLSLSLAARPESVSAIARGDRTLIDAPELSRELILTQLMWLPINGKQVALVWRFQVDTLDGNHLFDYTVDADNGAVWTRFDMTDSDSYRAYKEPIESANHSSPPQPADGRVVIADPADPTASPLGWHSDGTTNFTIHRGNNVHAYDDRDANNQPPATQPDCGASLNCDFPINFAAAPSTYTPAAISNLFYWNNLIHDVTYQYGFDEVGGNFQINNFGNGGAGNDAVRAEAQDGAGTNNANFSTPADGSPPRMQMFEWTLTNPRRDGDVDNGIIVHEYGHGISNRLVGGPCQRELPQQPAAGRRGLERLVRPVAHRRAGRRRHRRARHRHLRAGRAGHRPRHPHPAVQHRPGDQRPHLREHPGHGHPARRGRGLGPGHLGGLLGARRPARLRPGHLQRGRQRGQPARHAVRHRGPQEHRLLACLHRRPGRHHRRRHLGPRR